MGTAIITERITPAGWRSIRQGVWSARVRTWGAASAPKSRDARLSWEISGGWRNLPDTPHITDTRDTLATTYGL